MDLNQPGRKELEELQADLRAQFDDFKKSDLKLDITRGKPSAEQLALSNELDGILGGEYRAEDGSDVRNYGNILGIPEARKLGADLIGVKPTEVLAAGNSSLSLMYTWVDFAYRRGQRGPGSSWKAEAAEVQGKVKFLCPVPGYDRHFTICESLGIEMINVPFTDDGPDMDRIEGLVASDPLIKGIWCVPKYSNPTGHTYSDEVVSRLAALGRKAGKHFTIMWDNAYAVHHLTDNPPELANIMDACRGEGTESNLVITGSTSKITFAGGGISFLGSSEENVKALEKHLSSSTIGQDKVNQLRHAKFLKDMDHLALHMKKQMAIIKPKFDRTIEIMEESLAGTGMGSWSAPLGGYFISFESLPGLATRIVELAGEAGVKLTPAGATYPYGIDEVNSNIRIAPTFPSMEDLDLAMRVFVVCVQLASVNQKLGEED